MGVGGEYFMLTNKERNQKQIEFWMKDMDTFRQVLRKYTPSFICPDPNKNFCPFPYQQEEVRKILRLFKQKPIVAASYPCGSGKTVIALWLALNFRKTIYISSSPTQFKTTAITDFINVYYTKYGVKPDFSYSKINNPDPDDLVEFWTLGVFVGLSKSSPDYFKAVCDRADLLICDEAHHFPQTNGEKKKQFKRIHKIHEIGVKEFLKKGKKILSMSGTLYRMDEFKPFGINKDGSPDLRITMQQLVNMNFSPNLVGIIVFINAKWHSKSKKGDIYKLKFKGKNKEIYHNTIVKCTKDLHAEFPWGGHCFFTSTVGECEEMASILNKAFGAEKFIAFYADKYPQAERDTVLKKIENGELLGYVTCAIGAESVSVKRLMFCHLMTRTTSDIRLMQEVGRVMRLPNQEDSDKKPFAIVIDYRSQKDRVLKKAIGIDTIAVREESSREKIISGGLIFDGGSINKFDIEGISIQDREMWLRRQAYPNSIDSVEETKIRLLRLAASGAPRPGFVKKRNNKTNRRE